ncbi:MAG: tetratricopeptide repeat protein, partial [Candidatus Scalindua sp.]|nr:tetratricopeptide repeat protein [Candidatus Scalindua sp.]
WEWADIIESLGNLYGNRTEGIRSENLEKAIEYCQMLTEGLLEEDSPEFVANAHNSLGSFFRQRILGKKKENLFIAIKHFEKALQVRTFEKYPKEWADTNNNLGNAYLGLGRESVGEKTEKAIAHFELALQVRTHEKYPLLWASTQMNIAGAYLELPTGNVESNLEKADAYLNASLSVYNKKNFPLEWASIQNSLGILYSRGLYIFLQDNREKSIKHYKNALDVRSSLANTEKYADTLYNLGSFLGWKTNQGKGFDEALPYLIEALKIYYSQNHSVGWAKTLLEIAITLKSVSVFDKGTTHLDAIISHYNEGLRNIKAIDNQNFKDQFLVNIEEILVDKNNIGHIELAIKCFKLARIIIFKENYPKMWTRLTMSLAEAYTQRLEGNYKENQLEADSLFEECESTLNATCNLQEKATLLIVRARHLLMRKDLIDGSGVNYSISLLEMVNTDDLKRGAPSIWADVQGLLSLAYTLKTSGDYIENLEIAESYNDLAQEIYIQESEALAWAELQGNLANIYLQKVTDDKAANIDFAIKCCNAALDKISDMEVFELKIVLLFTLATAYSKRRSGNIPTNIQTAIRNYEAILTPIVKEKMPQAWGSSHRNLGILYRKLEAAKTDGNIELSIEHLQKSLDVFDKAGAPIDWASIHDSIGNSYIQRKEGEHSANIEYAISHFKMSLDIFTPGSRPLEWANTCNNLGEAYRLRIKGNRKKNKREAIIFYRKALKYWTLESKPTEFRKVIWNIGNLQFDEDNWKKAISAYRLALEASEYLLAETYSVAGRQTELGTTADLYKNIAYSLAKTRQYDQALLETENGKATLLAKSFKNTDNVVSDLPILCCLSAKWKNGIHVIVHKRSQNHEKKAQALQSGRKSSFTKRTPGKW